MKLDKTCLESMEVGSYCTNRVHSNFADLILIDSPCSAPKVGTSQSSLKIMSFNFKSYCPIQFFISMFIFGFGFIPAYGVEGAAIATTIGRGTAVIFQLVILFYGYSKIKIAFKDIVIRVGVMLNLIKVSLGGIGQFLIGTSSWVFLMRIMSEFGSEILAGYTIAIRVMLFSLMPAWGMSSAAASLVGQNLGAKQPDRAEQSVWKTSIYSSIFMGLVSILTIFSPLARLNLLLLG